MDQQQPLHMNNDWWDFPAFLDDCNISSECNQQSNNFQFNQQDYSSSLDQHLFSYDHNNSCQYDYHYGNTQYHSFHESQQQPPFYNTQMNSNQVPYQNESHSLINRPSPQPAANSKRVSNRTTNRKEFMIWGKYGERDYNTPDPYRNLSPEQNLFKDEPIKGLEQLAQKRYGGRLAEQAAALSAADAARTAKRITPLNPPKKEETVKDVLQRKYQLQRKQEQMQLLHQKFAEGLQYSVPPLSFVKHLSTQMPASTQGGSSTLETSDIDPPPTPVFSFPVVTPSSPRDNFVQSSRKSNKDASTREVGPAPKRAKDERPPGIVMLEMFAEEKRKRALVDKRMGREIITKDGDCSAEIKRAREMQKYAGIRSQRKKLALSTGENSSSTTEPEDSSTENRTGLRMEINEKGEEEERLYVRVHYINGRDPDHVPDGAVMTIQEYKRRKEGDGMTTLLTHSSDFPLYEYTDYRIKKPLPLDSQPVPSERRRPFIIPFCFCSSCS